MRESGANLYAARSLWCSAMLVLLFMVLVLVRPDQPVFQAWLGIWWLIASIAAIGFGIAALAMKRTAQAAVKAAVGILFGGLCLVAYLPIHGWFSDLRLGVYERRHCGQNMRYIAAALGEYAAKHSGMYPDRFSQLYEGGYISFMEMRCPARREAVEDDELVASLDDPRNPKATYVYAGKGLSTRAKPDTVLLYEKLENHAAGINVLHADGSVVWMDTAAARRFLAEMAGP